VTGKCAEKHIIQVAGLVGGAVVGPACATVGAAGGLVVEKGNQLLRAAYRQQLARRVPQKTETDTQIAVLTQRGTLLAAQGYTAIFPNHGSPPYAGRQALQDEAAGWGGGVALSQTIPHTSSL
jgi:hypothetical protein